MEEAGFWERSLSQTILIDDCAKDGGTEFYQCIAFFNRIPVESLGFVTKTECILGKNSLPPSLVRNRQF